MVSRLRVSVVCLCLGLGAAGDAFAQIHPATPCSTIPVSSALVLPTAADSRRPVLGEDQASTQDTALLTPAIRRHLLTAPERRVRFLPRSLMLLAADGLHRSPTFARLLVELQSRTVIVHVQDSRLPPGVAARLVPGSVRGGFRYLRVQVGTLRAGDDLVATLGHELFHALEIGDAPERTDARGIENLFRRIGYSIDGGHQFDTDRARVVELRIRQELSRRGAESKSAMPCR